jgi:hypothetical protein
VDAGGGFLAAPQQIFGIRLTFTVKQSHKIAAVVDDDMRFKFQRLFKVPPILLFRGAVPRVNRISQRSEARAYVVLGGERVGTGDGHFRAARGKYLRQISGFGFQMDGHGYPHTGERPLFFKLFLNLRKDGHVVLYPFNFLYPDWGQGYVPDDAHSFLLIDT